MLTGQALMWHKQMTLRCLDAYCGIEAREQQVVTDVQIAHGAHVRPDDVRQALAALKDDGLALRRLDDMRGAVWSVSPDGHKEAARLALEDGE